MTPPSGPRSCAREGRAEPSRMKRESPENRSRPSNYKPGRAQTSGFPPLIQCGLGTSRVRGRLRAAAVPGRPIPASLLPGRGCGRGRAGAPAFALREPGRPPLGPRAAGRLLGARARRAPRLLRLRKASLEAGEWPACGEQPKSSRAPLALRKEAGLAPASGQGGIRGRRAPGVTAPLEGPESPSGCGRPNAAAPRPLFLPPTV